MGDRLERSRLLPPRLRLELSLRPPHEMLAWGLPARIGHNNGPPLDDEPNDAFVAWRWRKAHREVWKNPSMSVLKFRAARAEAAGVSYHEYMLELLDTGRHLQAGDVARRRKTGPA
jgi:hypothetical protein